MFILSVVSLLVYFRDASAEGVDRYLHHHHCGSMYPIFHHHLYTGGECLCSPVDSRCNLSRPSLMPVATSVAPLLGSVAADVSEAMALRRACGLRTDRSNF